MLTRYKIYRGRRPLDDRLPEGIRQDTRRHTRHCLRPKKEIVDAYLASPSDAAWREFQDAYLALLEDRYREDQAAFDALAELASENDVFLGCSCPTNKNPEVGRCHTYLGLQFMKDKYPYLDVRIPGTGGEL
jgi:uncharacterized protein YeaO (DUF488 family)